MFVFWLFIFYELIVLYSFCIFNKINQLKILFLLLVSKTFPSDVTFDHMQRNAFEWWDEFVWFN